MAFSKARRLSDFIAADGSIPTGKFANSTITSAHLVDGTVAHADLHTNMDLTGKTVLVANASTGDSDTTAANTAFVQQEIAALVDSSPSALNTLNELAAALGDDANFSTTVNNNIATKLPLAGGTLTGDLTVNSAGGVYVKGGGGLRLEPTDGSDTDAWILYQYNDNTLRYNFTGAGADEIIIKHPAAANTTTLTIDTANIRLGINNTSPGQSLHVGSSSSGTSSNGIRIEQNEGAFDLRVDEGEFYLYDVNDSRIPLLIDTDGKVGIGTTDPEGPLHVRSAENEVVISDMSASSGSFTWMSYRRNNTNKFRVFGDSNDSKFGLYNDATGSSAGYYPFTITTGNNSTGSNYVGLNTNAPAKPLHIKRTSGWATVRLEGASDSGGELEFYAGSNLKGKIWAENTNGDFYFRAGGSNTQFKLDADGNWVSPHEDNVKRNFIGRGPFNVFDFSDNWHETYNPAANTEHSIGGSFTNPMGVNMSFPSNVTKQILQHARTPTGTIGVILEAVSDSNNTWNGGWNSGQFRVDPDKGYIFGYYCKRITSATDGTHYAGFSHGVAAGTGSSVDSNPYFQAFGNGNLPQGVWTLHYYHLHPRYYSGTGDGGIGGVYRCDTGVRILGQTAWKQPVNQTYQVFRTYNYYCANPAVAIQWYAPFVYEINGHEPTPAALLVNT